MGNVLFVSQLPLERCENLTAIWNMYDGEKSFRLGSHSMRTAEDDGYAVVVCDCLPTYIEHKRRVRSINIGHGITGDKLYGADEKHRPWYDQAAADQIDFAIATSEAGVPIVAKQFNIVESKVLPLGMPRTDAYFNEKFERPEFLGRNPERVYLYAPTFRNDYEGRLPSINWGRVDSLLDDDELMLVKRHYLTANPLVPGWFLHRHIAELSPDSPSYDPLRSCNVLLTDYSSIMFDAYLLGKPSVLTVDDQDEYLSKRGMYHPYPHFYSSRWLYAEGNEEALVAMLRAAAKNGMTDVERECIATVAGACDGHSTERVCDLIRSLL